MLAGQSMNSIVTTGTDPAMWQGLTCSVSHDHGGHGNIGDSIQFGLHILEIGPQVKLKQKPCMKNNHWIQRLYDLDQILGAFPFCLLPFTLLFWDDLKAWRLCEGSDIRNYSEIAWCSPKSSSHPHLLVRLLSSLLISLALSLALHILHVLGTMMCHQNPTSKTHWSCCPQLPVPQVKLYCHYYCYWKTCV